MAEFARKSQSGKVAVDSDAYRYPSLLASARIPHGSTREMQEMVRNWSSEILTHVTSLALPSQYAGRGFRFDAYGYRFENIIYAKHYSDAVNGISGKGEDGDPLVVHYVLSGWARFEDDRNVITVKPGQVCVRDSREKWRFWYGPGTVYRWLVVPRTRVTSVRIPRDPILVNGSTPEAKLLMSYLEMLKNHASSPISIWGRAAVEDAAISLLGGVISANAALGMDGRKHVLVEAAKKIANENLERCDLDPAAIAKILGVSVRTLHRSFAAADDSVMSYIRRRRIEEARRGMVNGDAPENISGLATKWHFSDSSHFIRQFKQVYGVTPAVYLRALAERRIPSEAPRGDCD
ncbi:helix-turn-helix domain-containing protein [Actinacidiphila glaucinigra]|uniref:helix-turn-helix domain-containing protein n=1 Tax=Actinacidiphila glaucinigra TaxID=235986 RepID=UPI00324B06C5